MILDESSGLLLAGQLDFFLNGELFDFSNELLLLNLLVESFIFFFQLLSNFFFSLNLLLLLFNSF